MRYLRVLVVIGALIGSLVPTMAAAQEPSTPKSEAIIEGEWKFTFTRQAVSSSGSTPPPKLSPTTRPTLLRLSRWGVRSAANMSSRRHATVAAAR